MAKPNQPKDIKPKTESEDIPKTKGGLDDGMKGIIINLVTTILICVVFLSVNYLLQSSLLNSKLSKLGQSEHSSSEEIDSAAETDEVQKGFIVDLGDFILNLSDVSPRKFLKVNVALEVSNKPEDTVAETKSSGHGGGHGEEAAPAVNPLETEMAQYKPSIRDAVITTLSSRTSAELATVAGKELAKEQITEAVNNIFAGDRDVLRVSFGQFIIQ